MYINTSLFQKKKDLVTNPVGLITDENVTHGVNLPLLDTHNVTLNTAK